MWCCSSGDHPISVYLDKFGNTQNMKIENLGHPPSHIVGNWGDFWPPKFFKKSGNLQQNVPFTKKIHKSVEKFHHKRIIYIYIYKFKLKN